MSCATASWARSRETCASTVVGAPQALGAPVGRVKGLTRPSDPAAFIARWQKSGAAERANYQLFLSELCDLLGVPRPDPTTPDDAANAYVFERTVTFHHRLSRQRKPPAFARWEKTSTRTASGSRRRIRA